MKKIARLMTVLALAAFTLTSCEDVPSPFGQVAPPNNNSSQETVEMKATGTGTVTDPFNVQAAINFVKDLGADVESETQLYVKGIVTTITEISAQYGNASFVLSDDSDGSNKFTAYRVKGFNNQKVTDENMLKVGDVVIVCGKIVNFRGNTPETVQNASYIYSVNGNTGGGGTDPAPAGDPKGTGTQADPFNIAAAIAKCKEIGETASAEKYYVKGIVVVGGTASGGYGNVTFELGDTQDATSTFTAFQVAGTDGEKLADGYTVNKGDEVVVYGPIYNYKGNTPETAGKSAAQIVTINGKKTSETGTGGGDTPSGGETLAALINGDFETWADGLPTGWKSASTASSAKLSQSSDAHGGSYSCCVAGDEGSNKRLASQELALEPGTYVFSFYAKATTADAAQVRPGQVPVTDGKAGSYDYGDYATINNNGWTQISHEFTLDAASTVCLVVMNPKKSNYSAGKDVLIDDATLTKK